MRVSWAIGTVALLTASGAVAKHDSAAELADALKGRTAEAPVRCVNLRTASGLKVIGTSTVVVRVGSLLYRNDPAGGCPAQTMNIRPTTGSDTAKLCAGDILNMVDFERGDAVGGCRLGEWTPYRRDK